MTKGLLEGFNVEDLSFHPIVEIIERVLKSLSLYHVQGLGGLPCPSVICRGRSGCRQGPTLTNFDQHRSGGTSLRTCVIPQPVTL